MRLIKFASLSIAIILICSMLTTACNQGTETTPTPLPSAPSLPSLTPAHPSEYLNDPEAVTLVECQFYGDHQENLDWKEIWPRLVEDRYGVSITMVTPAREKYMETIEKAAKSGKLTGIVEIFGGPYLENWKSMDLIYPLTDYLAENEVWNTLIPEHWKTAFTIEGDVWAIPSGSDGNISWFARSIRGDWLDKFGLEKPYTLDEFYEASYNFTYKDPNDSGKDDTVGFTGSGLFSLADIFAAYNARLSPNSDTTLVWNPNSEVWEDSMVKPEMVECLEFLRKCFSDGILDQNCFSGLSSADIRQRISSGLYGGALYWDSWILSFESKVKELYPEAYLECVGALSHNIDTNLVRYSPVLGGAPKVMMKT
ncbi:MAG: hypothetical protein R3232_09200, partial [Clostridia bacterium]|nr:hypothetical protein [Clostridia bacterium]